MEEHHTSLAMEEIELLNSLERISSRIPNIILKLEGFTLKKKDQLIASATGVWKVIKKI